MTGRSIIILIMSVMFLGGCVSSSGGDTTIRGAAAKAHLQMTNEGQRAMSQFRKRIEAGMSPSDVKGVIAKLSNQPSWPDWRSNTAPDDRSFQVVEGTNVEVWRYGFYREDAILKFEDDKLVSFDTKTGKSWQKMQNYILNNR